MEKTTKKTLSEMITEMFQAENLNGNQMHIIDVLCKINESKKIAENTSYEDMYGNRVDELKDFVVENDTEIWDAFNACTGGEIAKLVLLNAQQLDEKNHAENESRVIVDFKYANGIAQFCYVRIVYTTKKKDGSITRNIYNWNEEAELCAFNSDEVKSHEKKSDFFIKIPLN